MELGFKDRVAVVTGASKGIGHGIAHGLANEGVRTIIVARTKAPLAEAARQIESDTGIESLAVDGDVRDTALADNIVQIAMEKWGRVDILVNNAGGPPPMNFLEAGNQDWNDALELNLLGSIRMCRAVVPVMKAQKWGRIITIGSTVMKEPSPQMVMSATARAGVTAFMKAISIELAADGITANTIATGGVQTERLVSLFETIATKNDQSVDTLLENAAASIPMGRFASPAEFAQMIVFLASEAGGYITGECISVDGGLSKSAF